MVYRFLFYDTLGRVNYAAQDRMLYKCNANASGGLETKCQWLLRQNSAMTCPKIHIITDYVIHYHNGQFSNIKMFETHSC